MSEQSTPVKASAEGGKADGFPGGPARFRPFRRGDEHAGRTGIAVTGDVRIEAVGGNFEG